MEKSLGRLACKFDLDQSVRKHRKSMQVQASPGQTESQVDPSFQLVSTCTSVWPGLLKTNSIFVGFRNHKTILMSRKCYIVKQSKQ